MGRASDRISRAQPSPPPWPPLLQTAKQVSDFFGQRERHQTERERERERVITSAPASDRTRSIHVPGSSVDRPSETEDDRSREHGRSCKDHPGSPHYDGEEAGHERRTDHPGNGEEAAGTRPEDRREDHHGAETGSRGSRSSHGEGAASDRGSRDAAARDNLPDDDRSPRPVAGTLHGEGANEIGTGRCEDAPLGSVR